MPRLFFPCAALAAGWLACATPSAIPPVVVDGYQLYAKRDCPGVHRLAADSRENAGERDLLRLLDAYCLELRGDTIAAQDLYSSIVAAAPRTAAAHEASFRLRDIESLERARLTRAERKERAFEPKGSPRDRRGPQAIEPRATPFYPSAAKAAGIEGWVVLDFAIRSDGRVTDAIVLASDPPFVFDRAAVAAVGQWTYEASPKREWFRHKVRYEFRIDWIGVPAIPEFYR